MLWRTCVVILSVVAIASGEEEWLEVKTTQGPVRGRLDPGGELWNFFNIPYATAPTGKNKFKPPLPPPTWIELYDAVDKGIICPQMDFPPFIPEDALRLEDCLVANIHVPDTRKSNLPVLVYIHGGGFQIGMGNWLKLNNLMKLKDFIFVNFNYRLAIHGFLCLGTEDVPGNAGMKDQVALLQWVQQNIAAFGGNPNDVTIHGSSAGSASVDLLMVSKLAEGLFHKAIPESGTNLAVFAVQNDPLLNAKNFALKQNFTNVDDIYALEEFYKTLPFDVLISDSFLEKIDPTTCFSPCVERKTGNDAFLSEAPISILKRGDYKKVPLLYGYASMEGLIRVDNFKVWKDKMNEKFSDFIPGDLRFASDDEKEEVTKQIKEFYFGEKPVGEDNILAYVDYFSDIMFTYSTLKAVQLYAESGHNQIYLYVYSFVDEDVPLVPNTNVRGATHCAQTIAVFDGKNLTHTPEDTLSEEFRTMKKTIRELWHNFIITGNPVPEGSALPAWPAAGVDASPYMSLGQKVELRGTLSEKTMQFWDSIYEKYYRPPIPPPEPKRKTHLEL